MDMPSTLVIICWIAIKTNEMEDLILIEAL
jgi:hypothetical protein